jgi:hypothetical protein
MFRAWALTSFLSVAACISYPEVTLVDETRDAPVSPDGPARGVALVIERPDGDSGAGTDGGVLPHTERDARADTPPDEDEDAGGSGDSDDDDPGKGKGKPPKKKND